MFCMACSQDWTKGWGGAFRWHEGRCTHKNQESCQHVIVVSAVLERDTHKAGTEKFAARTACLERKVLCLTFCLLSYLLYIYFPCDRDYPRIPRPRSKIHPTPRHNGENRDTLSQFPPKKILTHNSIITIGQILITIGQYLI
jgi:hypothetical protein